MGDFNNFRNKTLRQIRLWAWAAAVLPITALASIFFIWLFGTDTLLNRAIVAGEIIMFAVAVVWWWWAIYVISKLVRQWDTTRDRVADVLGEIRRLRQDVTLDKTGND